MKHERMGTLIWSMCCPCAGCTHAFSFYQGSSLLLPMAAGVGWSSFSLRFTSFHNACRSRPRGRLPSSKTSFQSFLFQLDDGLLWRSHGKSNGVAVIQTSRCRIGRLSRCADIGLFLAFGALLLPCFAISRSTCLSKCSQWR